MEIRKRQCVRYIGYSTRSRFSKVIKIELLAGKCTETLLQIASDGAGSRTKTYCATTLEAEFSRFGKIEKVESTDCSCSVQGSRRGAGLGKHIAHNRAA
jgi:hypothetical protein